ncbi:MAG: DoxX family protein [Roseiarcus sp.]|jgi:putative oxidoreductase
MHFTIIPASWAPYLQALLRIMTGLLLLEHGTGKLLNFPVIPGIEQMLGHTLLLVTGSIELVGGALIVVGFLTRPAAFILAGFMAAAYFMAHFPVSFFPVLNQGEPAILYCFVFLYLAAAGPSVWAIDKA